MEQVSNNFSKLTFDTRLSNNKSTSNPVFILDDPFDEITGFQLGKFSGVNNVTNIRDTNNKIGLTTFTGTTGNTQILSIPVGNYTITTFKEVLNETLNTSGSVFGVSLNTMSNVLSISNTNGAFSFSPVSNDVYYELGLKDTQLNTTTENCICLDSYDLSGLKRVNVVSSDFGIKVCKTIGSNYNTILSIPIEDPYAGVITTPESTVMLTTSVRNQTSFTFNLYDERMRILSGMKDWSCEVYVRTS